MLSPVATAYLPIVLFMALALVVALAAAGLSFLIATQKPDAAKNTTYECGFDALSDSHAPFDVRFYLVAILFIIFDLEVAFLFPWSVTLGVIGGFGLVSMLVFLGVLTVGFIYEWKKGALQWD